MTIQGVTNPSFWSALSHPVASLSALSGRVNNLISTGRIGFNTACEAVVLAGLTWCLVEGGIALFGLADPDRLELTDYPMTMFGFELVSMLSILIFQEIQNSAVTAVPANAQSDKASDDS